MQLWLNMVSFLWDGSAAVRFSPPPPPLALFASDSPQESLSLFPLSDSLFLLCISLSPSFPSSAFRLLFPASVPSLHPHNLPPDLIPGLFCKNTQPSVSPPSDHSGFTLPTLTSTRARTTQHDPEHRRLQFSSQTNIEAHSEHRWNASDQRPSDVCLLFYWSLFGGGGY